MTAATFKKIAQPKTIAKSEIHIVLPHILAALITELYFKIRRLCRMPCHLRDANL
jgi:hypothetical protein